MESQSLTAILNLREGSVEWWRDPVKYECLEALYRDLSDDGRTLFGTAVENWHGESLPRILLAAYECLNAAKLSRLMEIDREVRAGSISVKEALTRRMRIRQDLAPFAVAYKLLNPGNTRSYEEAMVEHRRWMKDCLPGRLMAIEADRNAGLISLSEAQQKRNQLYEE